MRLANFFGRYSYVPLILANSYDDELMMRLHPYDATQRLFRLKL
jgi:hypothetical protein